MRKPSMYTRFTGAISYVFHKQKLQQNQVAEDVGIAPNSLAMYLSGKRSAPVDVVIKLSDYLKDGRIDQEFAGKFFKTIIMFSTEQWGKEFQDDPFAILIQQRKEERERKILDTETFEAMLTDPNSDEIQKWVREFLEEIAVELRLVYEVCEHSDMDYVGMVADTNERR